MLHLSKHITVFCLPALLITLLWTACTETSSQPDIPDTDGTATICLHIPQLKTNTRTVQGTALENAIHTLRVVILSTDGKSINQCFSSDELTNGSGTIILNDVPVGSVQMYIIANEASIGKNYDNLSDLQKDVVTVAESNKRKLLIKDEQRQYFPKRGSEMAAETSPNLKGLPMGWVNKELTIQPPTGGNLQTIEVELERQVAKLNIEMNNTLTSDIVIKSVSFGRFFSDRFYFYRESMLDVPGDAFYTDKTYENLSITVPRSGKATLVCYVYPSFAWKEATASTPYTIGFTTAAGGNYPPQPFITQYGALNSIFRNTQINIHATLSRTANVDISFEVSPWTDTDVEVPPFN